MAPADADARRELRTIRAMPYGSARTAAAEVIVRRIDAEGPQERLAEALLDLVEAYSFTGQGDRSFVTFARLLRLWDSQPELFDESDEHNLFWEFKWVAGDLPDYPAITREQADAFLEDMRRRFALAGKGLGSVLGSRFRWEWHSGDAGMEQARLAWLALPADDMDNCAACRIGHQVDYFTETGRFAEAIELGLTQHSSCNLEPTRTLHALALAHLNAGDATSALEAYRRAVATLVTSASDYATARGQGVETVARGGHIERALRFLREDHAELLEGADTPLFRLRFLLGVLAGLSANLDHGDLPTGLRSPDAPTLAQLHAWVHDQTADLASQFDARSGSDYYARLLTRALTATRTPVALDFTIAALAPPVSSPTAAKAGATPESEVEPDAARDAEAGPTGPESVAAALDTAAFGPGFCIFECAKVMATSVAVPTPPRIEPDQACTCRASDRSSEGPTGLAAAGAAREARDRAGAGVAASGDLRRLVADFWLVTMAVSCSKAGGFGPRRRYASRSHRQRGYGAQDSTSTINRQCWQGLAAVDDVRSSPIHHLAVGQVRVYPHQTRLAGQGGRGSEFRVIMKNYHASDRVVSTQRPGFRAALGLGLCHMAG